MTEFYTCPGSEFVVFYFFSSQCMCALCTAGPCKDNKASLGTRSGIAAQVASMVTVILRVYWPKRDSC